MGASVYIVTFYFMNPFGEGPEESELYGVYSSAEKAKTAALAYEKAINNNARTKDSYTGFTIAEYELDIDQGGMRDL